MHWHIKAKACPKITLHGKGSAPLFLKRSKGTARVAKFRGLSVCGSRWCHTSSRCKNSALLQSAKEIAQCARINAVALAFLISTEGANAANQWLIQNQHSRTLAKVRFSGACRRIFRESVSISSRACWYSLLVGLAEGRPLDLWRFRAERGSAFGMARS